MIEPKEMEVLSDLEAALHLTDDASTAAAPSTTATSTPLSTALASSVASNNNSSSSVSSISNSNTIVTQAIISSPSRVAASAPSDGAHSLNSQIDDVGVIVKQPVSGGDGASSLMNNNNDLMAKDRTHVTAVVVGTPPI